jgi:hypothetical protein
VCLEPLLVVLVARLSIVFNPWILVVKDAPHGNSVGAEVADKVGGREVPPGRIRGIPISFD